MTTLHIENTVRDYDAWKGAFDKFDRARRDRGVRSYRISRVPAGRRQGPRRPRVRQRHPGRGVRASSSWVWRTPQSQGHLIEHTEPVVLEVLEDVVVA